jgi:hypothetical protein
MFGNLQATWRDSRRSWVHCMPGKSWASTNLVPFRCSLVRTSPPKLCLGGGGLPITDGRRVSMVSTITAANIGRAAQSRVPLGPFRPVPAPRQRQRINCATKLLLQPLALSSGPAGSGPRIWAPVFREPERQPCAGNRPFSQIELGLTSLTFHMTRASVSA